VERRFFLQKRSAYNRLYLRAKVRRPVWDLMGKKRLWPLPLMKGRAYELPQFTAILKKLPYFSRKDQSCITGGGEGSGEKPALCAGKKKTSPRGDRGLIP